MSLSLLSVNAFAGSARSTLTISAIVQPVARVRHNLHNTLTISAMDVQRGYVEVIDPAAMQVASNSSQGYTVDVMPVSNLFTSVVVRGLGDDVELGAEGGMIVQRWLHAQTVSINLKFQFALRPDTQPGEYAFPLHMAVRPL